MEEKVRPTVRGRLTLNSPIDKAWLLLLMRNFKDAVEYAHSLMRKSTPEGEIVKLLTSRILNNAHYSHSALQRAKLYREQRYLKLKKPQLYSVGKGMENGNRNIRLHSTDRVMIKIPSATGRHRWITAGVRFGKRYLPIIEELVNGGIPYGAGVYLKDGRLELHVSIPLELYADRLRKTRERVKPAGHIASFDFNPDRICMVIEVTSHGFPKEKARGLRLKGLVELVDYAWHHGVTDYVVEKLSKPKKKTGSKSGNRKISRFAVREYLTHLKVLIPRYGGKLHLVNPAYASVDAIPLSRRLGLDVHTTSAYLLAIRALKSMNNHQHL